jgi:hypothetical protein
VLAVSLSIPFAKQIRFKQTTKKSATKQTPTFTAICGKSAAVKEFHENSDLVTQLRQMFNEFEYH